MLCLILLISVICFPFLSIWFMFVYLKLVFLTYTYSTIIELCVDFTWSILSEISMTCFSLELHRIGIILFVDMFCARENVLVAICISHFSSQGHKICVPFVFLFVCCFFFGLLFFSPHYMLYFYVLAVCGRLLLVLQDSSPYTTAHFKCY